MSSSDRLIPRSAVCSAASLTILLSVAGVVGAPGSAAAGEGDEPAWGSSLRLQGYGRFGFGGALDYTKPDLASDRDSRDMLVSYAFGFGVDYSLQEYVLVGGRTDLGGVAADPEDDADVNRHTLWNLTAVVKGRYPVMDDVEVYGAAPIGFTKMFFNDDAVADGTDTAGKVSLHLGLEAGANYFFSEDIGMFAEVGWRYQPVAYNLDPAAQDPENYLGHFGQFTTTVGVTYRL